MAEGGRSVISGVVDESGLGAADESDAGADMGCANRSRG